MGQYYSFTYGSVLALDLARKIMNDPAMLDDLKSETALKLGEFEILDRSGEFTDLTELDFCRSQHETYRRYRGLRPYEYFPQRHFALWAQWFTHERAVRQIQWALDGVYPADMLGNPIRVGDGVVWPVSSGSSSAANRFGIVTKILPNGSIQVMRHDPLTREAIPDARISTVSGGVESMVVVP